MIHVIQFSTLKTRIAKWKIQDVQICWKGYGLLLPIQYPDLEYETIKKK